MCVIDLAETTSAKKRDGEREKDGGLFSLGEGERACKFAVLEIENYM